MHAADDNAAPAPAAPVRTPGEYVHPAEGDAGNRIADPDRGCGPGRCALMCSDVDDALLATFDEALRRYFGIGRADAGVDRMDRLGWRR